MYLYSPCVYQIVDNAKLRSECTKEEESGDRPYRQALSRIVPRNDHPTHPLLLFLTSTSTHLCLSLLSGEPSARRLVREPADNTRFCSDKGPKDLDQNHNNGNTPVPIPSHRHRTHRRSSRLHNISISISITYITSEHSIAAAEAAAPSLFASHPDGCDLDRSAHHTHHIDTTRHDDDRLF